jgi:hypothetical protein
MECSSSDSFNFIVFTLLSSATLLAWGVIATVYYCDPVMSLPPGTLVAVHCVTNLISSLAYLSLWPSLHR